MASAHVRPGRQLVELCHGPLLGDLGEDIGQIALWLDAVQLAGFDERSDETPSSCSLVMACEQSILAVQSDGANGSLDGVAIDFDGAVIDEPRQPVTTLETVADDFGHFATPGQERQLLLQPTEQIVNEWRGVGLTHGTAFLGTAATDLGLEMVKRGDPLQGLGGDRRRSAFVDIKEVSSPMGPAKSQVQGIFLPAFVGQGVI